jgi:hypothetical protein
LIEVKPPTTITELLAKNDAINEGFIQISSGSSSMNPLHHGKQKVSVISVHSSQASAPAKCPVDPRQKEKPDNEEQLYNSTKQ